MKWNRRPFVEIAQFPPKIKLEKGKEYSFIPMEDVNGGEKYASPKYKRQYTGGGAKFGEGDTLFARITPCLENGKIAQAKNLIGGKGFGSTEYFVFRGIKDVSDSDFIYYLSKTYFFWQNAVNSMVGASGRQRADAKFLSKVMVPYPPLGAQRKIASILSAYDDLIENNLKRIKLLEELAQITYEERFVTRMINGNQIKDSDIETLRMEELVSDYMNGGWGKEEVEGNYTEQAYVIRGTDMPDISFGNFSGLPLRFHTKSNLKPRRLKPGDISIEMSNGNIGNVGRSFFFDGSLETALSIPIMCASFCKMLRPKSLELGYIIDLHLKYIHRTDTMLVYKSQGANGINNFRFEDMIADEELFIPQNEYYELFVEPIKNIYNLISNLRIQISLLKEARDLLLPRLMTGMIDVEKTTTETT